MRQRERQHGVGSVFMHCRTTLLYTYSAKSECHGPPDVWYEYKYLYSTAHPLQLKAVTPTVRTHHGTALVCVWAPHPSSPQHPSQAESVASLLAVRCQPAKSGSALTTPT
jgi:hypothetical protein